MIDILIVEDDPAAQERLQRVTAGVMPRSRRALAGSLAEARRQLTARKYGLVLLDVGLSDGSGLDLLPWMQIHAPGVDAVVITSLGDDATVLRAIRLGAVGYLLKNGSDAELELSLGCMERGGAPIDPLIARRILRLMAAPPPASAAPAAVAASSLSKRELEVLRLVEQGHSNREIAHSLELSTHTVEFHTKSIYRKLAVRSRLGAVHSAKAQGLLP
jgi:DNA-binding NarL/FixJ family response regulator